MAKKSSLVLPRRRYRSPNIPLRAIRRYSRRIVERFQPEKIILFGSYAYGTPHADSDVDLLVVLPATNPVSQAVRIRLALPAPFPMDLVVRTPAHLRRGLAEEDWFLRDVVGKGKVLYEAPNPSMGAEGRIRPRSRPANRYGDPGLPTVLPFRPQASSSIPRTNSRQAIGQI